MIGRLAEALLAAARDASTKNAGDFASSPLKGDCVCLSRKISLLSHLFEEIRDFAASASATAAVEEEQPLSPPSASSSLTCVAAEKVVVAAPAPAESPASCLTDLLLTLEVAARFLSLGRSGRGGASPGNATPLDTMGKNIAIQFQYVTWQLEKVLKNLPYDYFDISDEVREQVELVQTQLRRATERSGSPNLKMFSEIYHTLSCAHGQEFSQQLSAKLGMSQFSNTSQVVRDCEEIVVFVAEENGDSGKYAKQVTYNLLENLDKTELTVVCKREKGGNSSNLAKRNMEEIKKPDSLVIPEDFRCPISLELMRDPVIVATGQTYERSFIQRWIDCGNRTCPKTQQKLQNLTLTPNYVLRSLITQWCEANKVEQPHRLTNGRIRKSDGSYHDASGDRAAISELVLKLSSSSIDEQRSAAAEIRSLAKRSTDNRILISEAGAVPILVNLLSATDSKTQEHAVTSILNLSIYESNKGLIMLSGAVTPIIRVIRMGSMEARENAAAAIFSLSLVDENKITIGSTPGAIEALVELLQSGSLRGKKDAATALFNLCIYLGNKLRAVRAGILMPLLNMLTDTSGNCMIDEALTILSVLVSHHEGKVAIAKANMIPILIDLLGTGHPRNKENAAAILLALCKKDNDNLACIGRLGALIPLTELAKSGTDRAKRKVTSLLEHLNRL